MDRMTRIVVGLGALTLSALLFAAGWITAVGTGYVQAQRPRPRPRAAAVATAPPPVLPRSRFIAPAFADLAPADLISMASYAEEPAAAVIDVVAGAAPLDAWLSMQPLPLPDWKAIETAAKDLAPAANSYRPLIREAALRRALSLALVEAMARVESDFNPYEVSHKGALGLLQVMPETGARFGVSRDRLFDPQANLAAGTAYLKWLLERYRGDLDLALAAYNAGEAAVDQHGGIPPYRETQQYVRRVRAALRQIEARVN